MILNFGSCCIDHVYQVPYFVKPGETLPDMNYEVHPGGKGLNQSLAMANAGATVVHAGKIGRDGLWLKDLLESADVDTRPLSVVEDATGHAIIQVTPEGENAIIIHGGTNKLIDEAEVARVIAESNASTLLIQNELSATGTMIEFASSKQMEIVFNAAPMTAVVTDYPLQLISCFIVNELEAAALTGEKDTAKVITAMQEKFPAAETILTLGARGAVYAHKGLVIEQAAYSIGDVVDTTGAGDTFTGFYLAARQRGEDPATGLAEACRAAALCVTKPGAASSIPTREAIHRT